MIVEALINAALKFIDMLLALLPSLPTFPEVLEYNLNKYIDLIFDNLVLLDVFLPLQIIKISCLSLLSITSFCYLYSALKHVFDKIRFKM